MSVEVRGRSVERAKLERRGRVPAWLPLMIALVGFLWLLDNLRESAEAQGVGVIDLTRYRLDHEQRYFPEPWRVRLERILTQARAVDAEDRPGIERLRAALAALPFVEEVGEPEVVWPNGLVLPVALREPAACVRVGDDFLPVAEDGVLLPGYSYAPQEVYGAWLPVLGPHRLIRDLDPPPAPGDRIVDPALLAALSVARSMQRELEPLDQRRLGRFMIDASNEFAPDGYRGGVRLELEGARAILFGLPPGSGQPGELPAAHKWRSVVMALDSRDAGEAWDLFDVRYDEPVAMRIEDAATARDR